MKTSELFRKTIPFCMTRMFLGGALVLVLGLLLGLCTGIGWLFGDAGIVLGLIVWMALVRPINALVMNYGGYMVKAGHIAVLAEAAATGVVPADQVAYGTQRVRDRFLTANVYFAVDKLVSGAVRQIQKNITKLGNKLDFIPGMEHIVGAANFFVELSLGYIDECCLGWTFYKREQGAFQSACDGVVIYAQNIKHLLKNAAVTMLKVVAATLVAALVVFVPIGLLFKLLKWSGLVAFILACLVAWVVKFAFLDSYILCQTMAGYMEVAPTTRLAVDLYTPLSNISSSFKKLWNKGKEEAAQSGWGAAPAPAHNLNPAPVPAAAHNLNPAPVPAAAPAQGCFCGQCGAKNEPGAAFCGSCGAKM